MGSKMDQMMAVERTSGIRPPELDIPQPDGTILYIREIFYDVKTEQGTKISYSELKAYCELTDTYLTPAEVKAIMAFDTYFERGLQ